MTPAAEECSQKPVIVACPVCAAEIQISLAAREFADINCGMSYRVEQLPTDGKGNAVLLCFACAENARDLEPAGFVFELDIFVDMNERITEERRAGPPLGTGAAPNPDFTLTPEIEERIRQWDIARLVRHYKAAVEARDARSKAWERSRRASEIGLYVVEGSDRDDDEDVVF